HGQAAATAAPACCQDAPGPFRRDIRRGVKPAAQLLLPSGTRSVRDGVANGGPPPELRRRADVDLLLPVEHHAVDRFRAPPAHIPFVAVVLALCGIAVAGRPVPATSA